MMANNGQKRTRSQRVATVALPPGVLGIIVGYLRQGPVLLRIGLCAVTAVILWGLTGAWAPPFAFRDGYVPERDVLARIQFEQYDPAKTQEARLRARNLALAVYEQDPVTLAQLRAKLQILVDKAVSVETLAEFGPDDWAGFEPRAAEGAPAPAMEERKQRFESFRQVLSADGALEQFKNGLAEALAPFEQRGLLEGLPTDHEGNQEKVYVHPKGKDGFPREVAISDVLMESAAAAMQKSLSEKLQSIEVADRVFTWLKPQLQTTLTLNLEETRREQVRAADVVPDQTKLYPVGSVLAKAAEPLSPQSIDRLWLEHTEANAERAFSANAYRSLAALGMFVALYTLCGFYAHFRVPDLLESLSRFTTMLSVVTITVALSVFTSHDPWRAEMIPLLMFGMTVSIAYQQELALLLSAAVILVAVISIGHGLPGAVILMAATASSILMLRSIRSRTKLLFVGLCGGAVALLTTIGVGTLDGQPLYPYLLIDALRFGLWAVIAGSLMTCLLPLVERLFRVQTEISLMELGDPAHPLLQELVRRAPGTYNHSITVASLAEAAAESIGARGLLVRVGAYFHDIGKMLKPGYFVENQGEGANRHDSLVPAMSTLVIIAHVKDGADLARQHHLPESIIDFIQQHHGTTLVEYFYRRASEQSEENPDGGDVDESSFRYPGPKPQSREAGVLMLADAVESASRVLVEPTPSRIENLVEEITLKRLMDGQFDECGLTFKEVHTVEESLVKSLTAVYHGRVKYPDQQTA